MKFKLSAIILSFYLLFTQLGFGYVLHFCHNELSQVKSFYNTTPDDCCGETESCCAISIENDSDKCCDDVVVSADVDDNLIPQFDFHCQEIVSINKQAFDFQKFEKKIIKPFYFLNNHPAHAPPFYVLYSQFVIYG